MTKENFDYKSFASSMKEQAADLLLSDISDENKDYIETTIYNFVLMSGEALCNDQDVDFSPDDNMLICQVIAEWTYHKGVDLAHSDISKEYWDPIMQKIAFAMFEVAKQCLIRGVEQEVLLEAIEHHVNKAWKSCIEELSEKNVISDSTAEIAKELSNIDDMAEQAEVDEKIEKLEKIYNSKSAEKKTIKHFFYIKNIKEKFFNFIQRIIDFLRIMFIIAFIGVFPLVVYKYLDSINILSIAAENKFFMYILFNVLFIVSAFFAWFKLKKKAIRTHELKLQEIQHKIKELVNPGNMYDRLGVDTVTLTIGKGLLQISDINQEGELLPKITAMRQTLTDELGYIVPQVRIIDSDGLDDNEYTISIRENIVAAGYVYPGKYMVIADQWDSVHEHIPDDAIVGVDPTYQTHAYWISL